MQLRVQGTQIAGRLGLRRGELLIFLARDGVLRVQPLGTRAPRGRKIELRLRALELGGEPVDLDLKWARIDLKQYLALDDPGTFGEVHTVDESADPRAHLDGVDRLQLTREFVPVMQRPGDHFSHCHRRWRCSIRCRLSLRMAAGSEYDR